MTGQSVEVIKDVVERAHTDAVSNLENDVCEVGLKQCNVAIDDIEQLSRRLTSHLSRVEELDRVPLVCGRSAANETMATGQSGRRRSSSGAALCMDSDNNSSRQTSGTMSHESSSPPVSSERRRLRTVSSSVGVSTEDREPVMRISSRQTVYTKGRPPWYDCDGQLMEPFVIGICGGSASGKTTVAKAIIKALGVPWVTLLSMDSFYNVLSAEKHKLAEQNLQNFDHPDAFDFDLLIKTMRRLRKGKKVEVPIYNFVTHSRESKTVSMYGANVIIFEGILSFHNRELLNLLDMKVFVDTDPDLRLARRLQRDISQRGRELRSVLEQYERFVKPAYDAYIAPSTVEADIIVPRGGENQIAIDLIVRHVKNQLDLRGMSRVRHSLNMRRTSKQINEVEGVELHRHRQVLPETLKILPLSRQTHGLHTFIRNKKTPRDEFIFYAQRLIRLVIEYTLAQLPFQSVSVDTPQGIVYEGVRSCNRKICGVSILRAGESMEAALTEACQDVRIGKILIQTSDKTGEPELFYLRLPKSIKDYTVLLMDATVATGAAAMMAIRVLLDHEVPEEQISLVSLLMAESGVQAIAYAYPQVKIVTSAVDPVISDDYCVVPGIGNFGDRYFGTEPIDVQ